MSNASLNILLVELLVKGDRSVKIINKLISFFSEASAPKFHIVPLSCTSLVLIINC